MMVYKTTPEDIKRMYDEYEENFSKSNLLNSKTVYGRKESRLAGVLGEIVFKNMYPDATKPDDITYDFDYKSFKIDVKCKFRTVVPSLEYEASFFLYQSTKDFNADLYYFMSTKEPYSHVWICGFIHKADILSNPHMQIWRAGDVDRSNGMTFRKDTVCLKYKYLKPISKSNPSP